MRSPLLIAFIAFSLVSISPGQAAPERHDPAVKNDQQTTSLDTDTKKWSQQLDNLVEDFGKLLAGWTAVFVEKAHTDIDSGLTSLENWLNAQHETKNKGRN